MSKTLPLALQIAIIRARMVARRSVIRAVEILRAVGVQFATAARMVAFYAQA